MRRFWYYSHLKTALLFAFSRKATEQLLITAQNVQTTQIAQNMPENFDRIDAQGGKL